jgi:hypothetical protein
MIDGIALIQELERIEREERANRDMIAQRPEWGPDSASYASRSGAIYGINRCIETVRTMLEEA